MASVPNKSNNSNNIGKTASGESLSYSQQLVTYITDKAISDADLARAQLHLLDWLACAFAAKGSDIAAVYQRLANSESGRFSAIGVSGTSWQSALGLNAALGNVLEMDDLHKSSILHPGPVVIPAALTVAEMTNASMTDLLNAIIKGYEVTIRIGQAIGRSHYQYFHNTSTCAAFGAAMAAGHLLALNKEQLVSALGNVGSRTGGLWQMRNEQVETKQWHNSEAAKSGVQAALIAEAGARGPAFILEGPQGVFNALSQDAKGEKVLEPNNCWHIFQCSFKPWPACRHAHPAIDVTRLILEQRPELQQHVEQQAAIKEKQFIGDITHIEISTYLDAQVFCDRPSPKSTTEAKFSIQHAVASYLIFGEPKLEHYQAEYFERPDVAKLRDKISVLFSDEFESCYPAHYGASIKLVLKNDQGVEYSTYSDSAYTYSTYTCSTYTYSIKDTLGDPENPLLDAQLIKKAESLLLHAGLSDKQIKDICQMDWAMQNDIKALTAIIRNSFSHSSSSLKSSSQT